jgi:hypothetical protein
VPSTKSKIKQLRSLAGVVGKVEFPCGCYALVAHGGVQFRKFWPGVSHIVGHCCPDWKKHKYALADAERDLAERLKAFMAPKRKQHRELRDR